MREQQDMKMELSERSIFFEKKKKNNLWAKDDVEVVGQPDPGIILH